MRKPDFEHNLRNVFLRKRPERPTLFEFIINSPEALDVLGGKLKDDSWQEAALRQIRVYSNAGYDFVPFILTGLYFKRNEHQSKESFSLNEGAIITDRASFEAYDWAACRDQETELLDFVEKHLPDGMKILAFCPDGILENVIGLCGYENLCYLLADDRELVSEIFQNVGTRMASYLNRCADLDSVGIVFCNDDWGFRGGTMISHDDLREFVYPHYQNVCRTAHAHGKVVGFHSCGNFNGIYEELYRVIGFDGKHSNEDTILPVEEAYDKYSKDIAILGGIDIDFLCRATTSEIEERCKAMLRRSEEKGAYALGTGNSVARYIPTKHFLTLLKAANPDLKLAD